MQSQKLSTITKVPVSGLRQQIRRNCWCELISLACQKAVATTVDNVRFISSPAPEARRMQSMSTAFFALRLWSQLTSSPKLAKQYSLDVLQAPCFHLEPFEPFLVLPGRHLVKVQRRPRRTYVYPFSHDNVDLHEENYGRCGFTTRTRFCAAFRKRR